MIFRLQDLARIAPTTKGTLADRHQQLFPTPKGGSFYDRENYWLASRGIGRRYGTLQDRWRRLLSISGSASIAASIKSLDDFPEVNIEASPGDAQSVVVSDGASTLEEA